MSAAGRAPVAFDVVGGDREPRRSDALHGHESGGILIPRGSQIPRTVDPVGFSFLSLLVGPFVAWALLARARRGLAE